MDSPTSRRHFVSTLATASAAAALPRAPATGTEGDDRFSFLLLGDTHFDRLEHHDFDWMRRHYAKDISQVENYSRLTRESLPRLLKAAGERLTTADPATKFALHAGDLVEGICGNPELATRHCVEGWEFFKSALPDLPLLMTKGNHDVTGPGSVEAYRDVLLKETARELGREKLEGASWSFRQGSSLFAILDAYDRTAIDWLEELTESSEFRRLFVLLHLPVVPFNARANWRVYYHVNQTVHRERLVDLLGRHRAIVLCGHLHKYSLLVRRCRTGRFAQLAISSVWSGKDGLRQPRFSNVSDYGPDLVDRASFSPDTLDARRQSLSEEQPFIEHFEYGEDSGFAMVAVSGDDVRVDLYGGEEGAAPWRSVSISALLA